MADNPENTPSNNLQEDLRKLAQGFIDAHTTLDAYYALLLKKLEEQPTPTEISKAKP